MIRFGPNEFCLFAFLCGVLSFLPFSANATDRGAQRSEAVLNEAIPLNQRAEGMREIERVRQKHRTGANFAFDSRYPESFWQAQAEDVVRKCNCLRDRWGISIDDRALSRELRRICASTQAPERLEEIFNALEWSSVRIKECLIRPILADRLLRDRVASDKAVQETARTQASQLGQILNAETFASVAEQWLQVWRLEPDQDEALQNTEPAGLAAVGSVTGPYENEHSINFSLARRLEDNRIEIQSAVIPKISASEWWENNGGRYLTSLSKELLASREPLPNLSTTSRRALAEPRSTDPDAGSWEFPATPPFERHAHSAVWTGSEMIIWGGATLLGVGVQETSTGSRYDPSTDTWWPTSGVGAPEARRDHTAVWTGTEMIVWGGSGDLNTGGRYDPVSNVWSTTEETSVGRHSHSAVWTGTEMIVWGGLNGSSSLDSGARYDPDTDNWEAVSTANAPSPRWHHTAVWTGSEMIVWGGLDDTGETDTGGRYSPSNDSWQGVSTNVAPTPRYGHTAIWTGSEMLIWGNCFLENGGSYDPTTDSWRIMSQLDPVAEGTRNHSAIWTGSEMIVWGGEISVPENQGASYNPATDSWTWISDEGAPTERSDHTSVWTGSEMIVWGGSDDSTSMRTGGRYEPSSGTWTATHTAAVPVGRSRHTAVWTGSEVIIWGGTDSIYFAVDDGRRYDPITNSWSETSLSGAPDGRALHVAVWSGTEMIVWGGDDGDSLRTGGRYDPVADVWSPTTLTGAPLGGWGTTAVWTGSQMIIWGGYWYDGDQHFENSGGRYDPGSNSWQETTTANAPSGRWNHEAVWTGSEMIVWGGGWKDAEGNYQYDAIGGRYNPNSNSWQPTSDAGAPVGRKDTSAIWTGNRLIVWGGEWRDNRSTIYEKSGGSYNPDTNTWAPMSELDSPWSRSNHTAVWTDNAMIVWGGRGHNGGSPEQLRSGGSYDPVADSWTPTSISDAPAARTLHTATWTDSNMVTIGGYPNEGAIVAILDQCATPRITGPASICLGQSVTLDAGSGYGSYLWSPGGETTQTITVEPTATTSYSVDVSCTNGSASGAFSVTVFPGCLIFIDGFESGDVLSWSSATR